MPHLLHRAMSAFANTKDAQFHQRVGIQLVLLTTVLELCCTLDWRTTGQHDTQVITRLLHSGRTSNGRRRLSSSSVTLHGGPADGFIRAGQAMTSCRLQSNYNSTATLYGGPVWLRPVRATPCFNNLGPAAPNSVNFNHRSPDPISTTAIG